MNNTILYPHVSVNVSDVERSTNFYKAFFGTEPVKVRPGYAKFALEDPKLNFTLNEHPNISHDPNRGMLNHFGFQVASTEDVISIGERLRRAGLTTEDEMKTQCCYSVQDKTWVRDPDGINWEVFVVLEDAPVYSNTNEAKAMCCAPAPVLLSPALSVA